MGELVDIYDINRKPTGKVVDRYTYKLQPGEYRIAVDVFIFNSKNQMLMTKRAPNKYQGLLWEGIGGGVATGETSEVAILRELEEEIGLTVSIEEMVLYKSIRWDDEIGPRYRDVWVLKKDLELDKLVLQEDEVIDIKWLDLDEFKRMLANNEIVNNLVIDANDFETIIKERK